VGVAAPVTGSSGGGSVKSKGLDVSFAKALSVKTGAQHTGSAGKEGQYAKFLVLNSDAIPCTPENFVGEFMFGKFLVVSSVAAGFSKVPYTKKDPNSKDAKPMSELLVDASTRERVMRMWSYKKSSKQGERGVRSDEVCWNIQPGDCISVIINKDAISKVGGTGDKGPSTEPFPSHVGFIPPFSVLEIMVASKNVDQVLGERKDAIRVSHISFAPLSLVSYTTDILLLPSQLNEAVNGFKSRVEANEHVSGFMDTNCVAMYTRVMSGCVFNNRERVLLPAKPMKAADDDSVKTLLTSKLITLEEWTTVELSGISSDQSLDIPEHALIRAANALPVNHLGEFIRQPDESDIEWATTLLTIAADFGALYVFVASNSYWASGGKSSYRGVPVIDTTKLLACITPPSGGVFPSAVSVIAHDEDPSVKGYVFNTKVGHSDSSDAVGDYSFTVYDKRSPPAVKARPDPAMSASEVEALKTTPYGPPSGDLVVCRSSIPGEGYNVCVMLPDATVGERTEVITFRLRTDCGVTPHGAAAMVGGPVKRMRFGAIKG
jgi:hypothetical protein